jgi:hypothetical protein
VSFFMASCACAGSARVAASKAAAANFSILFSPR